MGFWFFLSVVVAGRFLYKSYKLRMLAHQHSPNNEGYRRLLEEFNQLKKLQESQEQRLAQLEETVLFGDFELKRQFNKLESELSK